MSSLQWRHNANLIAKDRDVVIEPRIWLRLIRQQNTADSFNGNKKNSIGTAD